VIPIESKIFNKLQDYLVSDKNDTLVPLTCLPVILLNPLTRYYQSQSAVVLITIRTGFVKTYFNTGTSNLNASILQRGKEALSDVNATGIAMLFSGGTFLYVATVHILPELAHRSSPTPSVLPDTLAPSRDGAHKGFSKLEVVVLVIGCLLPLVLAVGHKH